MNLTDDDGTNRFLQYDENGCMDTVINEEAEDGTKMNHECYINAKGQVRIKETDEHIGNIENYFNKADEADGGLPDGKLYTF